MHPKLIEAQTAVNCSNIHFLKHHEQIGGLLCPFEVLYVPVRLQR